MLFAPTREEVNEIADAKITIHDRHRFEIKLDIELADAGRGYGVDTYFFVPKALNIDPHTYPKEIFYRRIQRHIRFKTPRFSLAAIADAANPESPLTRIRNALSELVAPGTDPAGIDAVFSETKLLGVVSRGAIRDAVKDVLNGIEAIEPGGGGAAAVAGIAGAFLRDLEVYLAALSALRRQMLDESIPTRLRECFRFLDEFTSLTVQDYLSALLYAVRQRPDLREPFADADSRMVAMIAHQESHRVAMGYPSVLSDEAMGSTLPYRRGVLKKFISNVLFLNTEVSDWDGLSQVPLAIAAGLAMLFAAVVTVFAQSRYTTKSLPFVAAVVVSYIFKDRMKDWLKLYLSRGMVRWMADRKIRIRDPESGRVIGTLKEAFSFADQKRVPAAVLQARKMDDITSIDEEGKPERIIRYQKEVSLFHSRILRAHRRRRDLNDIMRFNIDDFLRQADDPTVDYLHLDPATGRLEHVQCQRVYHVNIVFTYRSNDARKKGVERVERIRLVLNRDGIVRLDQVLPESQSAQRE